ncbi:TM2 domain-containing protein [Natrialba aegyptia]|uniref:TM2 domain-containing protein n=1 Tax=Natrialba aegyptia DSM 13077 TaxID=1227491 RepID=M0AZZ7_9EURY|nr:TM2 domain-containing protein [Natrialba aegyptia]ELZ04241.1 hypothetical protein C480_12031 [Natrialba aegyptia DSM 13077]
MKHCSNCGEQLDDGADVCPSCGVDQTRPLDGGPDRSGGEKYCVECGERINAQAEICPECGVRQPSYRGSGVDSDRLAASILALLLGTLGAHKFYQGNVKLGVIYLCFFWTGIPGLLGIVEGILMLVADDIEYEEKYADGSLLGM